MEQSPNVRPQQLSQLNPASDVSIIPHKHIKEVTNDNLLIYPKVLKFSSTSTGQSSSEYELMFNYSEFHLPRYQKIA